MEFDWGAVITAVVSAISGGGIVGIINAKENKRKATLENDKTKIENDHSAADAWRELYERSDKENEELKKEIEELRAQVFKLCDEMATVKRRQAVLISENAHFRSERCVIYDCPNRRPPRGAQCEDENGDSDEEANV